MKNEILIEGFVRDGVHTYYENAGSTGYHQMHFNINSDNVLIQVRVKTTNEFFINNSLTNKKRILITGKLGMDVDDYYLEATKIEIVPAKKKEK
jgi:hypothetical protein